MWDLWWTKWHWGRFSPSTSVSPVNSHSTNCSSPIIYHLGLVQQAKYWPTYQVDSVSPSSSISLSRDRSIASSKLSFSVFGERLSWKSNNMVVFPFAFHIAVLQPLKPLWPRLLLCDHEPSQPSTVLCFMSLLMSLLSASGEFLSEFPSPRVILSFFPPP
jgi:hypothetical protein